MFAVYITFFKSSYGDRMLKSTFRHICVEQEFNMREVQYAAKKLGFYFDKDFIVSLENLVAIEKSMEAIRQTDDTLPELLKRQSD